MTEISSTVIKDSLLHNCSQLFKASSAAIAMASDHN